MLGISIEIKENSPTHLNLYKEISIIQIELYISGVELYHRLHALSSYILVYASNL